MWKRRCEIAHLYNQAFSALPSLQIPHNPENENRHAWHLYTLRINADKLRIGRDQFIDHLRAYKIGTSVHFIPLHIHHIIETHMVINPRLPGGIS